MRALWIFTLMTILLFASNTFGQTNTMSRPEFLRDRGPGATTSMFGTYVQQGELLFYPFYEHYHDSNAEYSPVELGYGLDEDFRGKYRADEYLLFLRYGPRIHQIRCRKPFIITQ